MTLIDIPSPYESIITRLQNSLDFVSYGLQSSEKTNIENLEIPDTPFQIFPSRRTSIPIADLRPAFKTWIIGHGLRDFVDSIGPSLEWARKICFFTNQSEFVKKNNNNGGLQFSLKLTSKEWKQKVIDEKRLFDSKSLKKKLEWLNEQYNFRLPETTESILSLNKVRNCLTHRFGVVGTEDLTDVEVGNFRVTWRKFQMEAISDKGSRILELPAKVENEKIGLSVVKVEKNFTLNSKIEITTRELVEFAQTFVFFAQQVQNSINFLQQEKVKEKKSCQI